MKVPRKEIMPKAYLLLSKIALDIADSGIHDSDAENDRVPFAYGVIGDNSGKHHQDTCTPCRRNSPKVLRVRDDVEWKTANPRDRFAQTDAVIHARVADSLVHGSVE